MLGFLFEYRELLTMSTCSRQPQLVLVMECECVLKLGMRSDDAEEDDHGSAKANPETICALIGRRNRYIRHF